jgi:tRNA G18 (ribose-2'-O)-methylase SpoU
MFQWVAAADDPRLDPFRHVGDAGWLRPQGLFVAEGRLVVDRLLDLHRYQIVSILVNRSAHEALRTRLAGSSANVFVCDDEVLAGVTGFNFHRGCLALVRRPAPTPPADLLAASSLLALEGVGNPDNVGGLFRAAAALGVDGILLDATTGDPYYRKAVRTSMGAALRIPFARLDDFPGGLQPYRQAGFTLAALTPRPGARSLDAFAASLDPRARVMVIVGSEGSGLAESTMAGADALVRIPIEEAVDSLNVVVAAAIALERLRSRRRSGG